MAEPCVAAGVRRVDGGDILKPDGAAGLSFTIRDGAVKAVMGRSGTGKSTVFAPHVRSPDLAFNFTWMCSRA